MADLAAAGTRRPRPTGPAAVAAPATPAAKRGPWRPSPRALAGLIAVALALVWELAVRSGVLASAFVPAPSVIAGSLGGSLLREQLWSHISVTLSRVAAGLALGAGCAFLIGLPLGALHKVRAVADPFIAAMHPIPKLALLPLLMLLLGLGEWPRIVVIAAAAFFPMLLNTMAGVRQISGVHMDVARVYGASRPQILLRVVLPGSLPLVLTGLRLSANVAFLSTIAVEMVYSQRGLGALIWLSWQVLRVEMLYATLVVIALIGIGLNALLQAAARRGAPWLSERERLV